ncbi:hypothetical protein PR048_020541 [Dryococelus australis]|uniref:Uncharacterized protein n=1 Tax=Dryococelus australis TaxID=614101 RepID=A0ABQ9H6J9_9NEOP|nr:hypothetical protein PR048_020541 [Dryococelus australis]
MTSRSMGNFDVCCKKTLLKVHKIHGTSVAKHSSKFCDLLVKVEVVVQSVATSNSNMRSSRGIKIDARLNVNIVHEALTKDHLECANDAKHHYYFFFFPRQFFQEYFDYVFGRPRVDVCSACESFPV